MHRHYKSKPKKVPGELTIYIYTASKINEMKSIKCDSANEVGSAMIIIPTKKTKISWRHGPPANYCPE